MVWNYPAEFLTSQGRNLALWVPVALGVGIGTYFSLSHEPERSVVKGLILLSFLLFLGGLKLGISGRLICIFLSLSLGGYSIAALRANAVSAPVLGWHYYGPVQGQISLIDRSSSGAVRVSLEHVYMPGRSAEETPAKVRISFHGYIPDGVLRPAALIAVTASLSPPAPPVEPGGFDFRRVAWFQKIGAVGYARAPPVPAFGKVNMTLKDRIFVYRSNLAEAIRAAIPARRGAFAAAIITGDRSAILPDALEDLRASNLAHLLAISGLHMGLLTGFVFGLLRLILVPLALWFPVKKWAAVAALLAGLGYLTLSGATVATQRAFIMTAVVFLAIILDRPALTLRSVALAATLILIVRPESLVEAGFQMSFAATTALVSVFEGLRSSGLWRKITKNRWRITKGFLALTTTTLVAGTATAPFSALHFNQISNYGFAANLLAVPAMSLAIMPAAVIAAVATPLGLQAIPLSIMGAAIEWVLVVAKYFADRPDGVTYIIAPTVSVLPLFAIGGLSLCILVGRSRIFALVLLGTASLIWAQTERPQVLVTGDGGFFGVSTPNGRALSKSKGHGFAARTWLENDGSGLDQAQAAVLTAVPYDGWVVQRVLEDDQNAASQYCSKKTILIAPKVSQLDGECIKLTKQILREFGATAIKFNSGKVAIVPTLPQSKNRLWGRAQ